MVGIPIASTLKTKEHLRVQELLRVVQSGPTRSELEQLSDQVIDWIRQEAYRVPENQEIIGLLKEPKQSDFLVSFNRANHRCFQETFEVDMEVQVGLVRLRSKSGIYPMLVSCIVVSRMNCIHICVVSFCHLTKVSVQDVSPNVLSEGDRKSGCLITDGIVILVISIDI